VFELDREVRSWSAAVHADRCGTGASVAELSDHLYCEIDRDRAGGMSDEQAFAAAVAKLGSAENLSAELAKNRSPLGVACAVAARLESQDSSIGNRGLFVAHGVVWASVVIAIALWSKKTYSSTASQWLILTILIPCWLGSEQILRRALRSGSKRGAS
jgi:hypothetical protein